MVTQKPGQTQLVQAGNQDYSQGQKSGIPGRAPGAEPGQGGVRVRWGAEGAVVGQVVSHAQVLSGVVVQGAAGQIVTGVDHETGQESGHYEHVPQQAQTRIG